ncbi:hypothetical protein A6769_38530 [Nostoc punctiforme NIES-2108]|uniref:Uncharacterized protein n=1 Tax=Nostoc punctiforme NIES-2108 TaxID=1356359 RepID=A0A367RZC8_NOSPU|nr:hypothetical protein A6769_38530 [Nostoc punctiforme NIES-2108]
MLFKILVILHTLGATVWTGGIWCLPLSPILAVSNKPTDYAAIIRAANQTIPEPPEWLSAGRYVYSPEYGVGEVMALLGRRLIVKFVEEVKPTQFGDWEQALVVCQAKFAK